jgi:putative FmdB family regulatory protein
MPIYEYRCKSCGNEYEHFQRISDDSKPVCTACGAGDVQRLMSLGAFHLKGAGWYVTDYKGKNAGNTSQKGEGHKGDGGESKSDGDAKTAAAEPAKTTSTSSD